MSFSETETAALQELVNAMAALKTKFEDPTVPPADKGEILDKYDACSERHKKLLKEYLVKDISFGTEQIKQIREIGERINDAADLKSLLLLVAQLLGKVLLP